MRVKKCAMSNTKGEVAKKETALPLETGSVRRGVWVAPRQFPDPETAARRRGRARRRGI